LAKINKADGADAVYKLSVTGADMISTSSMVNNNHVQNITVIDYASTVSSQIDLLQNTKITSLNLMDDVAVLSVTGSQYTNNVSSLSKVRSPYSLNVTVAQPQQASTLQSDSKVSRFALTASSNVSLDVANDIGVNFPTVLAMSKLDHIDFTQANTRIALTVPQLNDVQDNQSKLRGDYAFDVSGVSMTDLNDFLTTQPSHLGSVKVSDTSQAIATGWDDLIALTAMGAVGLDSLTVTGSEPVAITYEQWSQSANVLAKIQTPSLALLDVAPEQATEAAGKPNVLTVSIKGTAAEVAAEFDQLVTLGSKVDDIEITDDAPMMITQAQFDAGEATLLKINGGHYDPQIIEA
jgi:hypothetical protein